MHYNFIEIGANDRGNLTNKMLGPGIVIEPIPQYFHNIPRSPNYLRFRMAIADHNGKATMTYYDRADLSKEDQNLCLAGCASLLKHQRKRWEHIEKSIEVEVWDVRRMMNFFDVSSIHYLKIDTEGMDSRIVIHLMDWPGCPRIDYIQFETNNLTPKEEVESAKTLLSSKGYRQVSDPENFHDSVFQLATHPIL